MIAWARTESLPTIRMVIPSRLGSSPQYSSANIVKTQLPPLALLTPSVLPFKSDGPLILGDTTMAPVSLLMSPATKTASDPSATAPRVAPVTDPTWSWDSPEASAAIPIGPLRTWTNLTSNPYLRKNP